eukprot:scaffold19142_cov147-Isochrysis_galbana.AAC.1
MEKGVGKEWEGRGGVTGRQWTEVSRRAAASVSRVSTKDFFLILKRKGCVVKKAPGRTRPTAVWDNSGTRQGDGLRQRKWSVCWGGAQGLVKV